MTLKFPFSIAIFSFISFPFLIGFGVIPSTNFVNEIFSVAGFLGVVLFFFVCDGKVYWRSSWGRVFFVIFFLIFFRNLPFFVQSGWDVFSLFSIFLVLIVFSFFLGIGFGSGGLFFEVMNIVLWSFVIGGILAALASLGQFFGVDLSFLFVSPVSEAGRTFGFIRQPNHQATFLAIGLSALFFLIISNKINAILGYFFVFILAFALITTGSRTGFLQYLFLLFFYSIFCVRSGYSGCFKFILISFFVYVLSWVFVYYLHVEYGLSFYGLKKLTQTSSEGGGMRLQLWFSTLSLSLESPWLGTGFFSFPAIYFLSGEAARVGLMMENPHNLFLSLMFSMGFVFAFFVIFCLYIFLRKCFFDIHKVGVVFCASVVFLILIHSQFEYPLWYLNFSLIFFFFAGVLVGFFDKGGVGFGGVKIKYSACVGVFFSFLILASINNQYFVVSRLFSRVYSEGFRENLELARSGYWFRKYSDFVYLPITAVSGENYNQYLRRVRDLGCHMNEPWVQVGVPLALYLNGQKDEAYWIVYLVQSLSNWNYRGYDDGFREYPELRDFLRHPYQPSASIKELLKHCWAPGLNLKTQASD